MIGEHCLLYTALADSSDPGCGLGKGLSSELQCRDHGFVDDTSSRRLVSGCVIVQFVATRIQQCVLYQLHP